MSVTTPPLVVIGSPVQYISPKGNVFAATLLAIRDQTATLRVYEPSGANYTVTGVQMTFDDLVQIPGTWRALPLPPVGVAELPVQQFVEALKPLVEAAVEACVDDRLQKPS